MRGEVVSTRPYLPVELVYIEGYKSQADALVREKRLKVHGKAYGQLKRRISNSLVEHNKGEGSTQ